MAAERGITPNRAQARLDPAFILRLLEWAYRAPGPHISGRARGP